MTTSISCKSEYKENRKLNTLCLHFSLQVNTAPFQATGWRDFGSSCPLAGHGQPYWERAEWRPWRRCSNLWPLGFDIWQEPFHEEGSTGNSGKKSPHSKSVPGNQTFVRSWCQQWGHCREGELKKNPFYPFKLYWRPRILSTIQIYDFHVSVTQLKCYSTTVTQTIIVPFVSKAWFNSPLCHRSAELKVTKLNHTMDDMFSLQWTWLL